MKKVFLSLSLAIAFVTNANAQFNVTQNNVAQTPISNNQTFEFNKVDDSSNLGFFIFNTSTAPISMKVLVEDIINGNGDAMEVCFGECYSQVSKGMYIPLGDPMTILPNQHQWSSDDHMHHKVAGSQAVLYKFKFTMKDNRGIDIGTPFYVNYVYNPFLATDEALLKNGIKVLNTVAKDMIGIQSNEASELKIYSATGNLLNTINLKKGINSVMVSNFKPGIYMLYFKTDSGKNSIAKIMVK